ncbi:MAG: hypothetical protein K0R00_915 [Herbinix sp.]|jgi:hypothetical protein|nr:hypothetical protein [Herbinix sp.]
MDKPVLITEAIIIKIEKAFKIKLFEWQVAYLLKKPIVLDIKTTGRRQGKTFAYILDLLINETDPLDLRSQEHIVCDWWSLDINPNRMRNETYPKYFKSEVKEIYERLLDNGIPTRRVIFNNSDVNLYKSERMHKGEYYQGKRISNDLSEPYEEATKGKTINI